ncbi:hypothetical protein J7382_03465 [Shimia sp. R11_0]|uniref:hypothetical protein n=1 Tax=Shimia sp. R11_0 TaxID=2821096 RepID=UPI001ADBC675|nr:hypothetical protein [Shimia sp. R11_0]MBO9476586.1 hypothetical protein [Shimia sp. R11_0]
MSALTLTKIRLFEGTWEGALTYTGDAGPTPEVEVTYLGEAVEGVSVQPAEAANTWQLKFPIPSESLSDGVQTIVITDRTTGDRLDAVSFIAGEALADDLRAEIDLLRAELDMLKRAFRRHCVETM